jgi:hypothetical protein
LQDEKEAAVNKRAQVCLSVFVIARAPGRTPYAATHHANPRASTVRERRGGVAGVASTAWHLHAIEQHSDM